jgi:hypothetical protein
MWLLGLEESNTEITSGSGTRVEGPAIVELIMPILRTLEEETGDRIGEEAGAFFWKKSVNLLDLNCFFVVALTIEDDLLIRAHCSTKALQEHVHFAFSHVQLKVTSQVDELP